MLITTEGIVLKQNKIANNRRMIVLFTRDYGKITAGTNLSERGRNRSALALRPFCYSEYEIFKNREYYNINGAGIKRSFYSIGEDVDRFLIASRVIEYLNTTLEEGRPQPRTFELTLEFLETISETKDNYETLLYAYLVKNLGMQGIMPELNRCVDCGKTVADFEGPVYFSISGGGILCGECNETEKSIPDALIFRPHFDIVEVLKYMARRPLATFSKIRLKPDVQRELKRILSDYLAYYLNTDLLKGDFDA